MDSCLYHFDVPVGVPASGAAKVLGCCLSFNSGSESVFKFPGICSNSLGTSLSNSSIPRAASESGWGSSGYTSGPGSPLLLAAGLGVRPSAVHLSSRQYLISMQGEMLPTPLSSGQIPELNFVFAGTGHFLRLRGGVSRWMRGPFVGGRRGGRQA